MVNVTRPKVHMGTLTGGEAREILAGNPVVLLPVGSHEDQGPHAPMGDHLLAEAPAAAAALRATALGTRTLVAPVIPFGAADWFASMPGGIALSADTFARVLTDVIGALHRHGLTRLVILNGHGGNAGPIMEVARAERRRTGRLVPSLYLWKIAYGLLPGIVGAETARKAAGHGADPLTSLGLHLMADMMRPDLAPAPAPYKPDRLFDLPVSGMGALSFDGAEVTVPHDYDEVFTHGVGLGDPRLSSAATGAAVADALADVVARFAVHLATRTA
jgi:creatinine amidohydrolase